jgi:plastocyanin
MAFQRSLIQTGRRLRRSGVNQPSTLRGAVGALMIVLMLAACGGGSKASAGTATSPSGSSTPTIVIKNFAFQPASLTVAPGATVTVQNDDSATHTITASNKAFDTGHIDPGMSATFTAPTTPGTYSYICSIHQFMMGTLTVS